MGTAPLVDVGRCHPILVPTGSDAPPMQSTILVTHPRSRLPDYFGEDALSRLRGIALVRLNDRDDDLSGTSLPARAGLGNARAGA